MATCDFDTEENSSKWKGLFVHALRKVQRQVHPSLIVEEAALEYIESLIIRLLGMLCSGQPHSVQHLEERVQKTFPHPIDQWAINEAKNALETKKSKQESKKKTPTTVLPIDKIHPLLKEMLGYRIDSQMSLYLGAVLEYIAADILKLAGNYVTNILHIEISCQDIKVAMCADKVLMEMFHQDEEEDVSVSSLTLDDDDADNRTGTLTYDEVVKDMIVEETQYIRELNLIIKVFRKMFVQEPNLFKQEDIEALFANILDVHSISISFLSLLEDAMGMMDENSSYPAIGECFEDLAETEEFEVYIPFASQILDSNFRATLNRLLAVPEITEYLNSRERNGLNNPLKDAVAYVLPKLLHEPIYHCIHYFEVLKLLLKTSPNEEDRESLRQASGALKTLQTDLDRICSGRLPKRKPGESSLRFHRRLASRQICIQKMNEIQANIEGWDGRDISQLCNEFIMEGNLGKVHTGKNKKPNTERHIFLFDAMVVCCKLNARKSVTSNSPDYRYKERYHIRRLTLIDKEDTDDLKCAFELSIRDNPQPIIFFAKSPEEKISWMEALTALLFRSTLERILDKILEQEEASQPLRLPTPEEYKYAEEDSDDNIVSEEGQKSRAGVPLIKGGTLLKLIERLTYHKYADPSFVRTFLTTYRSFCKPQELLTLLIQRFEIPDPPATEEDQQAMDRGAPVVREDLKRFRKEYAQPIQLRVLNVFRHWVDHHYYDFERDEDLLKRAIAFLDSVRGKAMRKWVESITKIIQRRADSEDLVREITFDQDPPPLEWHIARTFDEFDLMTLHPIEIGRQVTLLEADLFRAVKPSELVGSVWTKKDKNITSQNLLKMIHHSNMFILWLEKCIVEAENFEERVSVLSRVIEIMMVFQELNNFNGVLEVVSAINSSSIYRLEHTFRELSPRKRQALEEAQELGQDHYKKYTEKLRSINPPCVPFVGMYLSNILFIEQGNPDFLPRRCEGLINFSKRRKVAEITGEIQQYQNQPYCLGQDPDIRKFFEDLNPLGTLSDKDFTDYLYEKSLEIEPRNCKAPPKNPKTFEYSVKSPGIKPSGGRHMSFAGRGQTTSDLRSPGYQQRSHEDSDATSPKTVSATPPSPRTPTTPSSIATMFSNDSSSSVFANVDIGNSSNSSNASGLDSSLQPPPVPPRTRRESSSPTRLDSSSEPPPTLPPKSYQHKPPLPPRRNSTNNLFQNVDQTRTSTNVNGSIPVPTVPPRTYKQRQQLPLDQRRISSGLSSSISKRREPPPPIQYQPPQESIWVPQTPSPTTNHSFSALTSGHTSPSLHNTSSPVTTTSHQCKGPPQLPPPPTRTPPCRPPRTPQPTGRGLSTEEFL